MTGSKNIENQHDLYEAVSVHRHKTILVYAIVCIMGCVLSVILRKFS